MNKKQLKKNTLYPQISRNKNKVVADLILLFDFLFSISNWDSQYFHKYTCRYKLLQLCKLQIVTKF